MSIAVKISIAPIVAGLMLAGGCTQVSVQGGEKPIHLIVDVNIKVDRELDQFFAFEKQAATEPATTQSIAPATTQQANAEVNP